MVSDGVLALRKFRLSRVTKNGENAVLNGVENV